MKNGSLLRHAFFGIEYGDFNPNNLSEDDFERQIVKIKRHLPDTTVEIFAPSVGMTNRVAKLGEDDRPITPWFIRTHKKADGGLVEGPRVAVAFFNGDCPMLCLTDGKKLAGLHLAYRCIIRADAKEDGIIEAGLKHFDDPANVKAFIFGGIGPCCWPVEKERKETRRLSSCRYPDALRRSLSQTTASPIGKALASVDLYNLAEMILLKNGVLQSRIRQNAICTCCYKQNGWPVYWSHTRYLATQKHKIQGAKDGRNMIVAWLE